MQIDYITALQWLNKQIRVKTSGGTYEGIFIKEDKTVFGHAIHIKRRGFKHPVIDGKVRRDKLVEVDIMQSIPAKNVLSVSLA